MSQCILADDKHHDLIASTDLMTHNSISLRVSFLYFFTTTVLCIL